MTRISVIGLFAILIIAAAYYFMYPALSGL